jgi:pentatricopeptide repeat protein
LKDLQPSPLLLGKLMEAYNRKQMYKETLTLFDKLKADNIRIPLVVYNAVLYTYFQLKDLDKVNDLLQNELGSRMINRYTLSVLLSEYAKLRDATKAFEVYQVMRQCKMKVSLEHCHSVMMASGRTGKFTLAMKLYKDLQSRNLHTEETILTMINVAKLCQDAASEIQLWKDKHELTRKLNGRYGAEDEEKQKEALKKLNKLCWEKFQTYPSFPVLSTTREDGIRSVTVGVVLAKEDAPFVTATGTSVNDAIFKVAPQALEIIQGFLQEHLPIVEQQLQKQQQQQQQQQQQ